MWCLVVFQHNLNDQRLPHGKGKLLLQVSNKNCNGPHTINAANVGSTRDLISRKNKTIDCKADTT